MLLFYAVLTTKLLTGLDYLVGSLLSSKSVWDLQKLNPYFGKSQIDHVYDVIAAIILHANRIGQINRYVVTNKNILLQTITEYTEI